MSIHDDDDNDDDDGGKEKGYMIIIAGAARYIYMYRGDIVRFTSKGEEDERDGCLQ